MEKNFYRSAQPTAGQFRYLAEHYGIKQVISLRTVASDKKLLLDEPAFRLMRYPISAAQVQRSRANVVLALRDLRRSVKEGPTLLHCEHGSDRTGMVTALYRILYDGWSRKKAVAEMRDKRYDFHALWGNITRFIEDVDIEQLRAEVGVS